MDALVVLLVVFVILLLMGFRIIWQIVRLPFTIAEGLNELLESTVERRRQNKIRRVDEKKN